MSVRRSALQPFTLSDGTKLEVGDWACAPSGAINQSAEHYSLPLEFNGFRFVDLRATPNERSSASHQPKPSKLTDVDDSFLMWGTGRMAWYTASSPKPLNLATDFKQSRKILRIGLYEGCRCSGSFQL